MTPFESFDRISREHDLPAALDDLANYLIRQSRFHELFEVRKMQIRSQLGLPVHDWQSIDDLPEDKGKRLEEGLLSACSEVGSHFIRSGDVQIGWQYLQPVGDKTQVRELLKQIELTDENVEAVIDIAVGHGVDSAYGFQIVLDRFGTCSAITTYESQLAMQPFDVRRGPAAKLVNHVYRELVHRVQHELDQTEEACPSDATLSEMIADRDWLFEGLSHHIDTTHLASTVKISRVVTDHSVIEMAVQLAEYGNRLHPDFHYADDPPFENIYADTLMFLKALLGDHVEETLNRIHKIALSQIEDHENLDSAGWYVYLLDQVGRGDDAVAAYLELVHAHLNHAASSGMVIPDFFALVAKYKLFDAAKQKLLERGDILGYATVAAIENQNG